MFLDEKVYLILFKSQQKIQQGNYSVDFRAFEFRIF